MFGDYSSLEVEPGDRDAALAELAERCAVTRPKVAALSLIDQAPDAVPQRAIWHDAPDAPVPLSRPSTVRPAMPATYVVMLGPFRGSRPRR